MDEQVWWYLARSTGIVAWGVLTVGVIMGLLLSTRVGGRRTPPAWLLDFHRLLGALAMFLVILHLVGLYMDSFIEFTFADLLIPFSAEWQPVAVAWGIVAFYMLAMVQISSMFMQQIPRKLWRAIHFLSYGLFWATAIHGATAGTDASHPAYVWASIVSIVIVLFLTVFRSLTPRWLAKRERAERQAAADAEAQRVAEKQAQPSVVDRVHG